ncbi:MerR family DNA-binding transcriptional regulator [Paenibacillus sp. P96]|uniref:MerR family DNA-binding transcriptional regulator n=1 Tax=Paenibacillus zeirhizosphaerae TaxID=2987519 RepID=A0ABT9FTY5_9BACL|nr:MerR family DNA-binding transcriptional regulator [Paenibacillus sp. P96]MDP4098155.1 MerR family DNA-binding transcriptional regulator [Paenibacillus sp. P96]
MRPKDLARTFSISTSTLRNYEAKGLIPPAQRTASGYRSYTDKHAAYLACLQSMAPAFGMDVTAEVLLAIQSQDIDKALWRVKESELQLYKSRQLAMQSLRELNEEENSENSEQADTHWMTVGKAAMAYDVPATTLRHWENVGLIASKRNPDNGYRLYNRFHLRKVLLTRTLRSATYSEDTVRLKQAIAELDEHDLEQASTIAVRLLEYFDGINRAQLKALFHLHQLIEYVTNHDC